MKRERLLLARVRLSAETAWLRRGARAWTFFAAAAMALAARSVPAEDLSLLPDYRPAQKVSGVLRSWGNRQMATLMSSWEEGFRQYQPDIRFQDTLKGSASAQFGLQEWVADLAVMGRQIWPYEYYGTYRRSLMLPVEIAVTTGSFDVPHKSYALTVFVHRDNPIARLTLHQLDQVFGAQRTGGWQGLEWHTEVARTAQDNIRTWGQLGLTGEWADRPVHVYGPPGLYPGAVSFFQTRVLGGADTASESLREYADRQQMMADLSRDPDGIGYTGMCYATPQVKPLALADKEGGPYIEPTRATVADRTYPLTRTTYIYFTVDTKTGDAADPRIDPKVKEFLRYILSRQGQEAVAKEGDYLPLTASLAREQLKKLD
jgi:phosphate transport system substrate-binding protein